MLTIKGPLYRFCDGITRRSFLKVGGLSLCGLSLPQLLRAEAKSSRQSRPKSVIMVFLPGGPSHLDLFDPKPAAPSNIRGEFQPIATNIPGIEISELLPRMAQCADKLAVIRSIVGGVDEHACHMCFTGHNQLGPQPSGKWPNIGAVISKLQGPVTPAIPPFVGLAARMIHEPYNDPGPGFVGYEHAAFSIEGEGMADLTLKEITVDRLSDRRQLLESFDKLQRETDRRRRFPGIDEFTEQAFGVMTSPRLRDALDLTHEDPRVLSRYGKGDPSLVPGFNAAPKLTEQLVIARRLVEAGARCVTLAFGAWDWHEKNFIGLREQTPLFDQGLSALVEDLHERGLDQDVTVVAWGEFGRSPRINGTAGRDHWPLVSSALLAGGGMHVGQVIGSTNRNGETAKDRPVHFREVIATVYHNLGIDVGQTTLNDFAGRPQFLTDHSQPIPELV